MDNKLNSTKLLLQLGDRLGVSVRSLRQIAIVSDGGEGGGRGPIKRPAQWNLNAAETRSFADRGAISKTASLSAEVTISIICTAHLATSCSLFLPGASTW